MQRGWGGVEPAVAVSASDAHHPAWHLPATLPIARQREADFRQLADQGFMPPATPRSSPRFQRPRPAPFSLSFHALWHQGKRDGDV